MYVRSPSEWVIRLKLLCTVSGSSGAMSPGEALQNSVRPLVKGGELKCLEGAYGQTREKETEGRKDEIARESWSVMENRKNM